ncbi:MAG: hypothetical protein PHF25_06670 [Candidatus Margulisbacteria bacterium]|nr:hypothetical protein [Candidatus Margulisiibacteriota bacterium]
MFLVYLLIGYLVGSIPGIYYFAENLTTFKKKTMVIPKKGLTISYYPAFSWQWAYLAIDAVKLFIFYYLLGLSSLTWVIGFTLGHIFPVWKPIMNKSTMLLVFIFVFQINFYLFVAFAIIETLIILFNKNFKEIPIIITTFLLSIFYWVSGADFYFVLVPLIFFIFSLLRFVIVSKDRL